MSKRIKISFLIALLFIPLYGVSAEEVAAFDSSVTIVETVVDFDKGNRTLTLRNKQGQESKFTLGTEVQNLDEIRQGAPLLVEYFNAFAVLLGPKHTGHTGQVRQLDREKQTNTKTNRSIKAVGTVVAIDLKNSLLTVQEKSLRVVVNVGEQFDLSGFAEGDGVEVVYIESYAIKVIPAPKIVGTVKINSTSVALGIGYEWGQGELSMYDGSIYTFDIQGISVLDIGVSLLEVEGNVFRVIEPEDMEGKYWAAGIGISYGNGVSAVTMKNRNDVIMHLTSKQKGMKLKLAAEGIKITNIVPKIP